MVEHGSEYFNSLDYAARQRYIEKLHINGVQLPDPYEIPDSLWSEDLTKWPNLEFGDIYSYLIDSKGRYTKESLKAYKSLQAYNYFINGHVCTVFHLDVVLMKLNVLKARLNPSQKVPDKNHEARVVVAKDGSVVTAHCKCMAG